MKFVIKYWKTLLWNAAVLYLSFASRNTFNPKLQWFEHQDKLIHMIMYLGVVFWYLYDSRNVSTYNKQQLLIISLIAVSFSILIEVLQPILSNRSQDFYDVVFNSIGCLLGVVFFKAILTFNRNN